MGSFPDPQIRSLVVNQFDPRQEVALVTDKENTICLSVKNHIYPRMHLNCCKIA